MIREDFEKYLRESDLISEFEAREVTSRINWIETTLNVNVEKMMESDSDWESLHSLLSDLMVDEEKRNLFFNALGKYRRFCSNSPPTNH